MNYLLTQEEYDALKAESAGRHAATIDKLVGLCQLVVARTPRLTDAGYVKVFRRKEVVLPGPGDLMDTGRPHGCIWVDGVGPGPMYCDRCPVQNVCPQQKNWSK